MGLGKDRDNLGASVNLVHHCSSLGICILLLIGSCGFNRAADRSTPEVAGAFSYQHDMIPEKPWSVHIVKVDRSSADFGLQTTLGRGDRFGLETLSGQVKSLPPEVGRPVAAINGDYFRNESPYVGDPRGLQILRGELVSGPSDWSCFWIDPSGGLQMTNLVSRFEVLWPNGEHTPFQLNEERATDSAVLFTAVVGSSTHTRGGRELTLERHGTNTWLPLRVSQTYLARVREMREAGDTPLGKDIMVLSLGNRASARLPKVAPGSVVRISTATWPDLKSVTTAIGGGPPIVRGGKALGRNEAPVRHPRTAIGWNEKYLFFVEVDGRQLNLSVGMTYAELAGYMIQLGCEEAMSLDGGGSATCWVYGHVMNSPSEGRERPMANALVLVHKGRE